MITGGYAEGERNKDPDKRYLVDSARAPLGCTRCRAHGGSIEQAARSWHQGLHVVGPAESHPAAAASAPPAPPAPPLLVVPPPPPLPLPPLLVALVLILVLVVLLSFSYLCDLMPRL